ncbi:hypothetical protein [Phenylobacterium sp.]|uniref:hypothetical protein n=1 Tax=Phenylobacterium sp. TaxID=1871053 RepID=UPI00301CFF41
MKAIEKIEALTIKVVHAEAEALRPGLAVETVYRWRAALKGGRGVADAIKQLLIAATRETAQPIHWGDFEPPAGSARDEAA